jgi:hypothetical protein
MGSPDQQIDTFGTKEMTPVELAHGLAAIVLRGVDHSPEARNGFVLGISSLLYAGENTYEGYDDKRFAMVAELRLRIANESRIEEVTHG